jgi:peptide/nickel transport system substrate-binding protein
LDADIALTERCSSSPRSWSRWRPRGRPAADTPRQGGILLAVIGADPPSLDPHQESTFATMQLVAPLYSTLLQTDPYATRRSSGRRRRVEDLARRPDVHVQDPPGIRFHDGSPLTAADVKATYDKIVSRPTARERPEERYSASPACEAPDAAPSCSSSSSRRPRCCESGVAVERDLSEEVPRQGPELLQEERDGLRALSSSRATRAARRFEGERNPDYFVKDRPYLNGYKFFISPETSVRAAAIRSGRAYIEFRDLPTPRSRRSRSSSATRWPCSTRR